MATYAPEKRQDFEALTVIVSVAIVLAIGSLVSTMTSWDMGAAAVPQVKGYSIPAQFRNTPAAPVDKPKDPALAAQQAFRGALNEPQTELEEQVLERFQQGVALLHAKRYDYAIAAMDAVLAIAPKMPEAYVNMGYAFLGLKEFGPARGAFEKALELKVDQVNAYYGLAEAFEGLKEYEGALGAMRSYIHLSPPDDPYLTKARSALWEWEGQLGRIKGIKPAKDGELVQELPKPTWSQEHSPAQPSPKP
jgi:tetratricopeptide (TPR) repeat protein